MELEQLPLFDHGPTIVRLVVWPGVVICDASLFREDGLIHLYCIDPYGGSERGYARVDAVGGTVLDALYNLRSLVNVKTECEPWVDLPPELTDYFGDA